MLVPGKAELKAAGAPPDADPRGQQLPLFACMEMSQEGPNGSAILPLFMCHADCAAAVAQATEADNPDEALEIVGLSWTASSGSPPPTASPPSRSSRRRRRRRSSTLPRTRAARRIRYAARSEASHALLIRIPHHMHHSPASLPPADSRPALGVVVLLASQREVGYAAAAERVRQLRQLQVALEALEDRLGHVGYEVELELEVLWHLGPQHLEFRQLEAAAVAAAVRRAAVRRRRRLAALRRRRDLLLRLAEDALATSGVSATVGGKRIGDAALWIAYAMPTVPTFSAFASTLMPTVLSTEPTSTPLLTAQ